MTTCGSLNFSNSLERPELLATPTADFIRAHDLSDSILASAIDETLADTATFCETYDIGLDVSANCVIIEAKRADRVWYAACIVLATTKADVNKTIRKQLDASKVSFAPMDKATSLSQMEYGGITPIGLPADWPILVGSQVVAAGKVIIGSGIRGSKLLMDASLFNDLPGVQVLDIAIAKS
jgi:prolyl-tRNA editing enzyme YbaK/EbsC (Cys-tRNA(Pro) deacylase)